MQYPGDTAGLGRLRQRRREGLPPDYDYDEALPAHYWEPSARADHLSVMGLDESVVFPNFGLLWERRLSESLPALTANMAAWNRWCATVVTDSGGRLHPVAHLTLRDPEWLETQLGELEAAGVRLGMIAPAAVNGRPLSHPDHDQLWEAFVHHGVTPVFHVADQPRVLDGTRFTPTPTRASCRCWSRCSCGCRRPSPSPISSSMARSFATPTCGSASSSSPRSGCRNTS